MPRRQAVKILHQLHHATDDDQRRRLDLVHAGGFRQVGESAGVDALARPGSAVDQRSGGVARKPGGLQAGRNSFQPGNAHVDDDCLVAMRQRLPVEIDAVILEMACNEDTALRMIAVREREAETGGCTERGGNAGDDLDADPGGEQHVELFAATPENEGVAALEAYDKFPGQRLVHQQLADVVQR